MNDAIISNNKLYIIPKITDQPKECMNYARKILIL